MLTELLIEYLDVSMKICEWIINFNVNGTISLNVWLMLTELLIEYFDVSMKICEWTINFNVYWTINLSVWMKIECFNVLILIFICNVNG
jgi:hypothetical protein